MVLVVRTDEDVDVGVTAARVGVLPILHGARRLAPDEQREDAVVGIVGEGPAVGWGIPPARHRRMHPQLAQAPGMFGARGDEHDLLASELLHASPA
jgi:hypothetical protein